MGAAFRMLCTGFGVIRSVSNCCTAISQITSFEVRLFFFHSNVLFFTSMTRKSRVHVVKITGVKSSTIDTHCPRPFTRLSLFSRRHRISKKKPLIDDAASIGIPCRVCFKRMRDPFVICEKRVDHKVCHHCFKGNSRYLRSCLSPVFVT